MRTKVVIVGAGPAGTLLAHLLRRSGIESVVLEHRSRAYVSARIRAGVLEHGTVDALRSAGLAGRLDREGFEHDGIVVADGVDQFRVDFRALTGRGVTIYGQTELQRDLYEAADRDGGVILDEVEDVQIDDVGAGPSVSFRRHGRTTTVSAEFVVGCDGAHGVCRRAIPPDLVAVHERQAPFAWLGLLSESPPIDDELVYARHQRGFALCSMRNPMLSRYYLQVPAGTAAESWSPAQFWDELRLRLPASLADRLEPGRVIECSVTPLRSFVSEPMRHGRLFLAGDASHVVPPTGAKGLNLAVADVVRLAQALQEHYESGSDVGLDGYGAAALRRVWGAVRFSWWMTSLLHAPPGGSSFDDRLQSAELEHLASSESARRTMAESYVGAAL